MKPSVPSTATAASQSTLMDFSRRNLAEDERQQPFRSGDEAGE
jgi:hypothetical protein